METDYIYPLYPELLPSVFFNGMAKVDRGNHYKLIKPDCTPLVYTLFEDIQTITDTVAIVERTDDKRGIINNKGEYITYPRFGSITPIHEGIASYGFQHQYGIFDSAGNIVAQPFYYSVKLINKDFFKLESIYGIEYMKANGEFIWRTDR